MSSKSAGDDPRFLFLPEDPLPANRVIVILLAVLFLAMLAGGIALGIWLANLPEPRVRPTPMPAASSTAIATSSAQTTASQSVRVTVRRSPKGQSATLNRSNHAKEGRSLSPLSATPDDSDLEDDWEFVFEATQAITTGATASAAASSSIVDVAPPQPVDTSHDTPDHGRLGVIAATMPGIIAADLQLIALDVSPATRWLVDVDMELGLDVAGNLEAGAVGVTAGGKAFVGVYGWSRWNLGAQGIGVGVGLRF